MRVEYHVSARLDVLEIVEYYEASAGAELAAEFYGEFLYCIGQVADRPTSFPTFVRSLRRANLHRFPYHMLFRLTDDSVRILVVRHHGRNPSFGIQRR
jgi:plasmid stabilization system protein ParE